MKKILVISDVHGDINILESILNSNNDVDYKIYLGDFQMSKENQKKYSSMFDYVVTGNCDYPGISKNIIYEKIEGKKFMITHGHHFGSLIKKIDFDQIFQEAKNQNVDIILHGHDHIAANEVKNNINRFNPGSTTLPRKSMNRTYGIISINKGELIFSHIVL